MSNEVENHKDELLDCLKEVEKYTKLKFETVDKLNCGQIEHKEYRKILRSCEMHLENCRETILCFIQF